MVVSLLSYPEIILDEAIDYVEMTCSVGSGCVNIGFGLILKYIMNLAQVIFDAYS